MDKAIGGAASVSPVEASLNGIDSAIGRCDDLVGQIINRLARVLPDQPEKPKEAANGANGNSDLVRCLNEKAFRMERINETLEDLRDRIDL